MPGTATYERHRPETTVLYQVVEAHLDRFLSTARERHGRDLPRYVQRDLRAYLECGRLEYGFARARCDDCGRGIAVAFSCKKRGACPSCNARRMAATAAQLVDRVFPDVPVRQWVISVPFELRRLLAAVPAALTRLDQIFTDEIFRWQRERARELGIAPRTLRGAGITHMQRFGGALNLNVHLHAVHCDGVFVRASDEAGAPDPEQRATFQRLRAPTAEEVSELAMNVAVRFLAWCRRRGLVRDDPADAEQDGDAITTGPLEECQQVALQLGALGSPSTRARGAPPERHGSRDGTPHPDAADDSDGRFRRVKGPHSGAYERWDVHAGVTVPAGDHAGRERLLRYLARAPVSLERMSLMPDGRIAYELRHAWRAGRTHVLLEPLQLLARLAALVPPPRHPLLRFHGAFAPNSPWRRQVVPIEPPRLVDAEHRRDHDADAHASREECAHRHEHRANTRASPEATGATLAVTSPTIRGTARETTLATNAVLAAPGVARASVEDSSAARCRERGPSARSKWYIDWATLLRRVYGVNALACPCGGKLRFVELVDNERDARAFLATRGATVGISNEPRLDSDPTLRAALRTDAALGLDEQPDYDAADAPPDYHAVEPPPDSS